MCLGTAKWPRQLRFECQVARKQPLGVPDGILCSVRSVFEAPVSAKVPEPPNDQAEIAYLTYSRIRRAIRSINWLGIGNDKLIRLGKKAIYLSA